MIDIKQLVQTTLDEALYSLNIMTFYQHKLEISPDINPNEYVVYSMSGKTGDFKADDVEIVRDSDIIVRYFYNNDYIKTNRSRITQIENLILSTMVSAKFVDNSGAFDLGDIDDNGYMATGFLFTFSEVI